MGFRPLRSFDIPIIHDGADGVTFVDVSKQWLLSGRGARRDQLYKLTSEIQNVIVQHIEPLEQWGVLPYFSYRSQAEQAVLQTAPWP